MPNVSCRNYCDFLNVDLSAPEESGPLHLAIGIALSWCDQATILYAVVPQATQSISVCRLADPGGIEINYLFIPMH